MLILVGESASGKTSVAKVLAEKYGMKMAITYTTRPMREGEVNHVDYHFINIPEYEELKDQDFFAETAEYRGWLYGSAASDYEDPNTVVVLTPHGLRQVKRVLKDKINNINVIYINVPRRDRLIKLLQRGDNIEEAYRRSLSDVGQFDGIEDEVDYVVHNDGYRYTIPQLAYLIHGFCENPL